MQGLRMAAFLLFLAALAGPLLATDSLPRRNETAAAQGAQLRIVLPMVSRDVLPDVVIESITVSVSEVDRAVFRYRVRNIGDAPADLSRFTMQAWFSADGALQKGIDIEAGISGFTVTLAPNAVLEAEAEAASPDGSIDAFPFLVLELDSAGAVF